MARAADFTRRFLRHVLAETAAAAVVVASAALLAGSGAAHAEVPSEELGRVETLPERYRAHWIWIADPVMRRSALIDVDDGRFLGMVDGGFGIVVPLIPADPGEFYVPATFYSRGSHGERTDVLAIYEATSLIPANEVILPPKRAISAVPMAHAALTDDGAFAAVFNLTPEQSLSIVDLKKRTLTAVIPIPGCSLVYPAGGPRLASLCNDGALRLIEIDPEGHQESARRTEPFFDPESDPVLENAVRAGRHWLFFSVEGVVHPVELSGNDPVFEPTWRLTTDEERADNWRIGGRRRVALHERTGRLYVLMHQGGPDTYKDPGSEVWVYNLATKKRVQRIELVSPGVTIQGFPIELGDDWSWPMRSLSRFLLDAIPASIEEIVVTQDEKPVLVTTTSYFGGIGVYDAMSGDLLRRVYSSNFTNVALELAAPYPVEAGRPGRIRIRIAP